MSDFSQRPPTWYFAAEAVGGVLFLAHVPLLVLSPPIAGAAFILGPLLYLVGRSGLRRWARAELLRRVEGAEQARKSPPGCQAAFRS